ncbi:MAG: hypothetical protein LC115_11815 [Bacteroidia bacterium]|nr:hypothetical protein [Bacteroidia bacterium]
MDGSVCAAKHEEQNYAAGVMSLNVLAAWRSGGNRSTNVQLCTKVQSKNCR